MLAFSNFTLPFRRVIAAGFLVTLATGPAAAFPFMDFPGSGRSGRAFDGGGSVVDYMRRTRDADRGPGVTVISGTCASACTMKLGMRNACVTPDATLLFHQASSNGARSEIGSLLMLGSYPRGIRQWVARTGALSSDRLTEMSGRQAISLGIRKCPADVS